MMQVLLVPLNAGSPTYGPYRVTTFSYSGDSDDSGGPSTMGHGGYCLRATTEDGCGTMMICTGAKNGRYSLQVASAI